MTKQRKTIFFIGTEAELIKLFPIIMECKRMELPYKIVTSGQNDLWKSEIWDNFDCGDIDIEVNHVRHITTGMQLLGWWFRTLMCGKRRIKKQLFDTDFKHSIMVVHGDTVSTYLGALLGKRLGMKVAHVEAGLRSFKLFDPFPEEIDRILTSRIAKIHYAPGEVAAKNLKKTEGVVNTKYNTLYDSLQKSLDVPLENEKVKSIIEEKYFVFVMHRQENLMNDEFVREIVNRVAASASPNMKCVVLLHAITRNKFSKLGILELLKYNPNFVLLPRTSYCDFMKLLSHSEFVITDGGSNQEELYYMGKPCLIIRNRSERNEGLGQNACLYGGDYDEITRFIETHKNMKSAAIMLEDSPSRIIAEDLKKQLND